MVHCISSAFDGCHSQVLGYETMNEPFAGNVHANPLLYLPGVAGKHLMRMHEAVAAGIRKHDQLPQPTPFWHI